jgi:hypothetical protein
MGELHLEGVRRGKARRTTTPDQGALGLLTCWSGTSRRSDPTSGGSPTSPMWRPGRALSMWPWSSTPSAASSSAGRPPARCAPTWPWTPWRWPAGAAKPSWRGWCITRTGAANTCPSATPNAWPRPGRSPRWAPEATATTTPGRDDHRAVQDRTDPPVRPLEGHRRSRVRHPGVGRLVQPPPAPGAHRLRPTGRVRGRIPETGGSQLSRSTQVLEPPMNPGRFKSRLAGH